MASDKRQLVSTVLKVSKAGSKFWFSDKVHGRKEGPREIWADDVEYFQKKLFDALKIPPEYRK